MLFVIVYNVVTPFKSMDEVLKCEHLNESYCLKCTFPQNLFIIPYKAVLTFESVDEILKCDHSNENY